MTNLRLQSAAHLLEELGLYVSALDIKSYRFIYHSYKHVDKNKPCYHGVFGFDAPCPWCPIDALTQKPNPEAPEIYESPHPITNQTLKKIAFLTHAQDQSPIKLDVGLDAASDLGRNLEESPQWAAFLTDFLRYSLDDRQGPLTHDELLLRSSYEELKVSENEHRVFFESHAAATLIHDREIVIQKANRRFEEMIGLGRDAIIKKQSLLEFIPPQERLRLIEAHHKLFSGELENTYIEIHLISTSGVLRFCRAIITRLPDNNHAMITLIDLSDKESSEQKLQAYNTHLEQWVEKEINVRLKSQQRYRQLFHGLKDAVFVYRFCDGAGLENQPLFSETNQAACRLLDYSHDELLAKGMGDILTHKTLAYLPKINKELGQNRTLTTEIDLRRKDTQEVTVEASFSLETIDQEQIVITVARDITQRLEAQKKVAKQEKLLIQQSKMAAMGEMIGNIAHQWRQPLNILAAMLYNIKRDHAKERLTPDRLQEYYQEGRGLIDRMSQTIDDFKNFFKPGKKQSGFCVREAIESTLKLVSPTLKAHHIHLEFECQNSECRAYGSQSEFSQALMNLLTNAMDALCSSGVSNPRITLTQRPKEDQQAPLKSICQISVQDNAGGVPEAIKNRIFEPYFTTKEQGIGTGIGLYMTQLIAQKMGAKLWVENDAQGAVFVIELPEAAHAPSSDTIQ